MRSTFLQLQGSLTNLPSFSWTPVYTACHDKLHEPTFSLFPSVEETIRGHLDCGAPALLSLILGDAPLTAALPSLLAA